MSLSVRVCLTLEHTAWVQMGSGQLDPQGSLKDAVVQGGLGCSMEPHGQPASQHASSNSGRGALCPPA